MERFITIKQFCEINNCSRSTVYREIKAGRLKVRKLGRASRISDCDATAWQGQLEVAGRAQPSL